MSEASQTHTASETRPGSWSERFQAWFEFFDDRLNPIVVKELRQAVQGRFLGGVLVFLLLGQLFVLAAQLVQPGLQNSDWFSTRAGREYFLFLLMFLLGTCLFFIPAYSGYRLSTERSDKNVDLVFISTLSPSSIIWGKFLAAALFTLFVFSACLPFMAVSFMLRGIDFLTISLLLLFAFFVILVGIQFVLFAACLSRRKLLRLIVAAAAVGVLSSVFSAVFAISRVGVLQGLGSTTNRKEFWVAVSLIACYGLSFMMLFHRLSVAMISPPSYDRALPVRRIYTLAWLVTGLVSLVCCYIENTYAFIIIWMMLHTGGLCCAMLVAASEPERLPRRVLRTIPTNGPVRVLRFLFSTGLASGLLWSLSLFLLSVGVMLAIRAFGPSWSDARGFRYIAMNATGTGLFTFSYVVVAILFRRSALAKWVRREQTWLLALILFLACSILPLLFVVILGLWPQVKEHSLVLSPVGLGPKDTREATLLVGLVWSAVSFGLMAPILLSQFSRFRRSKAPTEDVPAPQAALPVAIVVDAVGKAPVKADESALKEGVEGEVFDEAVDEAGVQAKGSDEPVTEEREPEEKEPEDALSEGEASQEANADERKG